jgi:hypothetical protein
MAYNIIKGRVEFSNSTTGSVESLVDIWRNQSIGGTKTFTSNITSSGYWDSTRNQKLEPLSTLIGGDGADRVLTSDGDGTLTAESNVTITTAASITSFNVSGPITGSTFSGSARGITGIILDADHLATTDDSGRTNRLSASFICLGIGISSSVENTELQVTGGTGIIVDGQGVQVLTASNGGLKFTGQTLQVDAANTTNKGGGPSNNDEFIIADSSDSDAIKNLTYSQIKTAITDSISVPITTYNNSGDNRIITSVNSTTVNGEANLSFDGSNMEMTGGIVVSGSRAVKNDSTPAFRVSVGTGNALLPDHVSINMGTEARLKGNLAVSNTDGGARAGIFISKTGSSYLVDGDDIGLISFNTRGDTTRTGTHSKETSAVAAQIFVEADGSEHNGTSKPGRMSFWTCPSGTINPVERMTINNSGNIGIGTTTIPHTLTVAGTVSASLAVSALSFTGDGSNLTGIGAGGIFTEINASLANTTSSIAVGGTTAPDHRIAVSGAISASLNISASGFYGDGSGLTGVTGEWDGSHTGNATIVGTLSASNGFRGLDMVLDAGGTGRVGVTGDTDLMTLTADTVTVAGAVNSTTLSASSTVNLVGPTNFGKENQTTVSNVGVLSSSATATFANATLDQITVGSADINGGNVDGAVIGASDPAAGTFLTVSASSTLQAMGVVTVGNGKTTISAEGVISSSAQPTFHQALANRLTVQTINAVPAGAGVIAMDGGLNTTGHISSSLGVHVTGSEASVAIGDHKGTGMVGMLAIRPSGDLGDAENNVLHALFQRSEASDLRTIFAVTGSGKVAVGGGHLNGVLNISGSGVEKLISAKSDVHNPAFYLSGSGEVFIKGDTINSGSFTSSGSVRAPLLRETIHTYAPGDTNASYIRFYESGRNTGFDKKVIMVKPYLGNLDKIIARGTSAAGSTAISFHKASDGSATPNGTPIQTITVDMSSANTSYTFIFDPATSKFAAGDIVSVKVDPSSDPGDIVLTCVWEYDTRTT